MSYMKAVAPHVGAWIETELIVLSILRSMTWFMRIRRLGADVSIEDERLWQLYDYGPLLPKDVERFIKDDKWRSWRRENTVLRTEKRCWKFCRIDWLANSARRGLRTRWKDACISSACVPIDRVGETALPKFKNTPVESHKFVLSWFHYLVLMRMDSWLFQRLKLAVEVEDVWCDWESDGGSTGEGGGAVVWLPFGSRFREVDFNLLLSIRGRGGH